MPEIAKLRELYPLWPTPMVAKWMGRSVPSVAQQAIKLGLKKDPFFKVTNQFEKGLVPWNKGKKGYCPKGSEVTQFKPGCAIGILPVGTRRIDPYGVHIEKVGHPDKWRPVKDMVWEAANGPIPSGHFVVCANRDKGDLRLENLLLVDRAENLRRNLAAAKTTRSERMIKGWQTRRARQAA